eukprot:9718768-Alexandrium_andersonii.AAC.1
MCIRDRPKALRTALHRTHRHLVVHAVSRPRNRANPLETRARARAGAAHVLAAKARKGPVSYTHLTLPTICSV